MAKTLAQLAVGSRVVDNNSTYNGESVVWRVLEHGHAGDPEGSTALISDKILTIKPFDAKEPANSISDRRNYGNSIYAYSNILQWLNSDEGAWMWYTPQHEADHPPDTKDYVTYNPYESEAGFLNGFSSGFKESLMVCDKPTNQYTRYVSSNVYDKQETVSAKVHLLSREEVGLNQNDRYYTKEGSQYSFFGEGNESRYAYPTQECVNQGDFPNSGMSSDKKWSWLLRTPNNSYSVRMVFSDGDLTYENAYDGKRGIRPSCFIPSETLVSETPDANGAYSLFFKSTIPDDSGSGEEDEGTPPDGIWREPKTNWTENDIFILRDYNRIRNNLVFLNRRISDIWGEFSIQDMGNDPTSVKYIYKVQYFNAIEENLEILNKHSLIVKNYGFKQTFYPNGVFIGFSELNRIESATLKMKQIIDGWEAGLRKIPFRLGAPKGLYI